MKNQITIDETTTNKLRNLFNLINEEESKEYEDMNPDDAMEYTDEILKTIRSLLFPSKKDSVIKYLTYYYETNHEVMESKDITELLDSIEYMKSLEV